MKLYQELLKREEEGRQIKVGLVGAGQMGTDIVSQVAQMKGMQLAVVADIDAERAFKAYQLSGYAEEDINKSVKSGQINNYIAKDQVVVTEDGYLLPHLENLDVIIDATGVPKVGARLALDSILNQKHIVMMNVEADVTVGPILKKMADKAGIVYTGAAGDEPAGVVELYNFAKSMGFNVIAGGKGKNNPLDYNATPADVEETARKKGTAPEMLCCFVDGTKTMVEMTAVSNATGLIPDVQGMHGPDVNVDELPGVFSLQEQGGILSKEGIVDYALGNVAPGVFLIVSSDYNRINYSMGYSKMGPGPNYVLYRPYHLVSLETPLSAARAVLFDTATIAPNGAPVSETITVAKKDLAPGETIDEIGGYCVRGSIETAAKAKQDKLLPLGLAPGAKVKKEVKQGELVKYDQVELDSNSIIFSLRKLQDQLLIDD